MDTFKKYLLKFFLPLSLLFVAGFYFIYTQRHQRVTHQVIAEGEKALTLKTQRFTGILEPLINDIYYLSRLKSLDNYLEHQNTEQFEELVYGLQIFGQINSHYDQLRYLDTLGRELIRIDNTKEGSIISPPEKLQDKSAKHYVQQTLQMEDHQIYISPIELNKERGQIEQPFQPVLRVSMAIYDPENVKRGMIIINHKILEVLQKLIIDEKADSKEFMLLNSEGYVLAGPERFPSFGFEFQEQSTETFARYYPEAWQQFKEKPEGHVMMNQMLFVYRKVNIRESVKEINLISNTDLEIPYDEEWIMLSRIPLSYIEQEIQPYKKLLVISLASVLLFLFGLTYILSRERQKEVNYLENLKASNRTLREQEKALKFHNRELNQKNRVLEQFIYITSHDLQEPVNTLNSFAELLQEHQGDTADAETKEYLNYIRQAANRMKQLITDLLQYTRIGHQKELIKTDLNKLLESALKPLAGMVKRTQAHIQSEKLPVLFVYPEEVQQVFYHLISNAIKFSAKGQKPEIVIQATEKNTHWVFSVQDNGMGIEPQQRERIFNVFQRLNPRTEYPGTGIGLAIVKKVIELHGGKIWVEANQKQGSTFFFTLSE